jgi:hypothetical protein
MSKKIHSFLSIGMMLVTIGLFLIPAGSASGSIITSPTGKIIVTPWSTPISFFGYGSGSLHIYDATQQPSPPTSPGSSSVQCVGSQSGDYTGNYPLRFDKSHPMCSGFDIPQDNSTPQPDTTNSISSEVTPIPTVIPYPMSNPEGLSQFSYIPIDFLFPHTTPINYFSTGYMPLAPHTNPAIYYPESQGKAYEGNLTNT